MKEYNFFAMLSRMKYISRWGLMRNTISENIAEHSLDTAIIAHGLAVIGNTHFGKDINAEHIAVLAMFHDTTEIITGDLPTPVKYFAPEIREAYKEVEKTAMDQLLKSLPDEMNRVYRDILDVESGEEEAWKYVKAADKISALIKCVEEKRMGNTDFEKAEQATLAAIHNLEMEEAEYFLDKFLPAYNLTLDEQA
ncbi:MAG: 5'-deoxynucleotidase [Lachnospiraceae bacterium]|nr:5'-deoxynucleotidase [Lachnospiraceae bacterium]MBQ4068750.1 5'-deoxynucleotidase [Lachnospiraceae bacterium]